MIIRVKRLFPWLWISLQFVELVQSFYEPNVWVQIDYDLDVEDSVTQCDRNSSQSNTHSSDVSVHCVHSSSPVLVSLPTSSQNLYSIEFLDPVPKILFWTNFRG